MSSTFDGLFCFLSSFFHNIDVTLKHRPLFICLFFPCLPQPSIFSSPFVIVKSGQCNHMYAATNLNRPSGEPTHRLRLSSDTQASRWHRVTGSHGARPVAPNNPFSFFQTHIVSAVILFQGSTLREKRGTTSTEELYPRMTKAGRVMMDLHNHEC